MTKNIIVAGSINIDLVYAVPHIVKEGETIHSTKHDLFFGGKGANQAVTAGQLGADVKFVGSVGADDHGIRAKENMERKGVNTEAISSQGATGQAIIQLSDVGENSIVLFPGANFLVTPEQIKESKGIFETSDILLLQLEIPIEAVEQAAKLAYENGTKIILNPAPARDIPNSLLQKVSILTPNETELELLTGIAADSEENLRKACHVMLEKGVNAVVVTLGSKGAFYMTSEESGFVAAQVAEAVDTTGAGDSFNGALAVALCHEDSLIEAITYATIVAAFVVTRMGAQPDIPKEFIR
ncbi:ribokinase [Viridibacillus sp. YIM B01967]|uniref:Ribokinase n=1 Tax=Viridibacillus soli TaxID=2798301 RepID=A0ABS1H8A1_9BACL|nr:ribokinase [Viridibacillus soli]MBK3495546.1 ribokinase [Viridibacillus soli]